MFSPRIRHRLVASLVVVTMMPAGVLTAPQASADPRRVADVNQSDLTALVQRFTPALDAVAEHQAHLAALEAARDTNGACPPDAASASIGDALLWAVDAQRQSDADVARGRAAVEACRLNIADDAVDGLTQQNAQVADLVKVFAGLTAENAPASSALDSLLDQARWVAALKADAPDLADLAQRLGRANESGADHTDTAARVNRLLDISRRADAALRQTVACVVAPQQLAVVRRIVTLVEPIQQQTRDLDAAVKAAKSGASACALAVENVPAAAAGPSWLPSAASARKKPAAAMPTWLPDKNTPATQTATARSADVVGEAREKLIAEEALRIDDESRKTADRAQARRTAEEQTAREAQTSVQPSPQSQALAQQQVVRVQQQRAERRTSFLGLLGRVSAAVGIMAAGIVAPPALAALIPMAGFGAGGAAIAAASLPATIAKVSAVASAAMGPAGGPPGTPRVPTPAAIPGLGTLPVWSAQRAAVSPSASDPFFGVWQCTINGTQVPLTISGGQGSYGIAVQGANLVGRLSGNQVVFDQSVPQNGGTCQVQIRLQPQGALLAGTSSVACSKGEQASGAVQCHR